MGIRRRILLSFLALFLFVFGVASAVTMVLVSGAVEQRLAAETESLGRVFAANPDFERSPAILESVRIVWGAESVRVVAAGSAASGPGLFRAPAAPGRELVISYGAEFVSRGKREAVLPLAVVGAAGLALLAILAYATAQTIARPIEELSRQARALPGGEVRPVGGGAELDQLVEAMNRMLAEVRRTERLAVMGRMAAGVAHELKNPLSSIKLTVQMLREEAGAKEPYDLVLREIERLELAAEELTGAAQPLRPERVALGRVVTDVLELLRPRLEHLSIRVEKRLDPAVEGDVDVARFKSCVMNLLLNGAQAMPSGGPLTIELVRRDGRARLAITDAGGGVPRDLRDRIFEPFVTTKQDGVGLGLSLTKRIVEDHGGRLGFEDAAGGTTFWIELPHG